MKGRFCFLSVLSLECMRLMDLVFFGIQGSGKGTQAKRLAEEFDFYIFEAGGELRTMKESGTELGETVRQYIDNGELVPFEIIMQVVREAIALQPQDQKILFDGIPRDEDQMKAFNEILFEAGREFHCIEIVLSEEEAMERIAGRAAKEGRVDDADEEKVRRRIELFKEKTKPVIAQYQEAGKLDAIDGTGTLDAVYERLKEIVDSRL